MSANSLNAETEKALRQLDVAALNFAYQSINIANVRSAYVRHAQEITNSLRIAYRSGEMSAKAAGLAAYEMRNALLDLQRRNPHPWGGRWQWSSRRPGVRWTKCWRTGRRGNLVVPSPSSTMHSKHRFIWR